MLPISAAVIAAFVGADGGSGKLKWLIAPIFGITFLLADYVTFGTAWLSTYEKVTFSEIIAVCEFPRLIIGTDASAIGIVTGILIKRFKIKNQVTQ